jgi:hypothetical protein
VRLGQAGAFHAGEHARQLGDAAGVVQQPHRGAGVALGGVLLDREVAVGVGGDLRQVGDDQHLVVAGELGQAAADRGGGAAADPGVDLVEHQRRRAVHPGEHDPQRQHDPRQLAAGGGPGQRPQRRAGVGGQLELDPVKALVAAGQAAAVDLQAVLVLVLLDRDPHLGVGHGEVGQLRADGLGEAVGGLPAPGGEGGAEARQGAAQLGGLGLQRLGAERAALQLGQPPGRAVGVGQHGRLVVAVLALQVTQERDAGVDLVEAARVDQHLLGVGAQGGGEVGDLGGERLGAAGQLAKRRVVAAGPGQGAGGGPERGRGAGVVVAAEQLVGDGGRLLQRLGVGEPLGLGFQLGRLPHPDLGGADLVELVAQQVGLAGALAGPGGQLVQLAGDLPQAAPAGGELGPRAEHRRPGEAVQQVALDAGAEQALELVLAVHLDQRPDDVGDGGHGGHAPLQLRAAAAGGLHLAGDDDLAVLGGHPGGLQRGGHPGDVGQQAALDQGLRPADADRAGVGPLAEQQREGVDHHGLAGAGLAGQHVETRGDLEVGIVDHPEVADAKLG